MFSFSLKFELERGFEKLTVTVLVIAMMLRTLVFVTMAAVTCGRSYIVHTGPKGPERVEQTQEFGQDYQGQSDIVFL